MRNSVRPESRRCTARHQVGPGEFHHAADGTFGDTVQLVNVRWACCGMDAFSREQFRELLREEFPGVIAVQCAHHTCRCILAAV
eukprot:3001280-Pleurochrysis_carterae.AAC.1